MSSTAEEKKKKKDRLQKVLRLREELPGSETFLKS